jgi:hypothetical protein
MVDMDLDVIQSSIRGVFVDDEDEFEEHRQSMHYPQALVDAVRQECDRLVAAVTDATGPFDGTAQKWMAKGRKETR